MATVSGNFVSRLNLATSEVVPETKALAKGKTMISSEYYVPDISYVLFILLMPIMLLRWNSIICGMWFAMISVVTDFCKEGGFVLKQQCFENS